MERRLSDKDCSQSGTATTNRTFCGESGEALSSAIEREGQGRVCRAQRAPGLGSGLGGGTAQAGVSTAEQTHVGSSVINIERLRIKYLPPVFDESTFDDAVSHGSA